MKKLLIALLVLVSASTFAANQIPNVVLAVHGGTGIPKSEMTEPLEKSLRAGLEEALKAGHAVLKEGRSSTDAVVAAVKVLEDNPLFNAGKGAVFTREGKNELDASIMEGSKLKAGSVAGVTRVKNPIEAARAVMDKTPHVMLAGVGADNFAKEAGLTLVDATYFWTKKRWDELQKKLAAEKDKRAKAPNYEFGTVGAVALDSHGNLAAATSTGGMTGKRPGRIGDSPIIGAGTYADNASVAVSATGHGEYFIRYTVAHDIAALVKYKGLAIKDAAAEVIHKKLYPAGGEGAVIVLDAKGNYVGDYHDDALYRGYITKEGAITTALY